MRSGAWRYLSVAAGAVLAAAPRWGRAEVTGVTGAHDPSTVIADGSTYYYYATGQGIISRSSTNGTAWSAGPSVFATQPAWITSYVPGFTGFFWAPDVVYRNNQFYLYYAASTFGSKVSVIGLATSPTLNPLAPNYAWTDQGLVVSSNNGNNFNAIDPSILQDSVTGRMWMSYGSYNAGIFVRELDGTTGKPISGAGAVNVAYNSSIEASALIQHGGYYYLMVNWGTCCNGIDSTYEIRMGRSTSPTGPFLDRNGVNMLSGGGTVFYDDDGSRIGPGHFAYTTVTGTDQFSYHYYDGNADGAPHFGLSNLYWSSDAWPSVAPNNPDWSGTASSTWSTVLNWNYGTAPNGVGSVANFVSNTAGRYAVTLDAAQTVSRINFRSASSFTIGTAGGPTLTLSKMALDASATINVASGSHTIAAPLTTTNDVGINITPAASSLTLGQFTAASVTKYGYGVVVLGGVTSLSGQLATHNGTVRITGTLTTTGNVTAGNTTGDAAAIVIAGNAAVTVGSDFNVGDTGSSTTAAVGSLTLQDSAAVTVGASGAFVVGSGYFSNTAATGTVNQSGGQLTANGNFDGAFIIGGRGSALGTGTYNLTGGTVTANTNIRVGGYGSGTVNQSGGVFTANQYLSIGRFSGASGAYTLTGGSLTQSNAGNTLIVGEAGSGALTVGGTGVVTSAGGVVLGLSGGSGNVTLSGGTLTTPQFTKGSGTGTITFDGGTVRTSANKAAFIPTTVPTTLKTGGATIDTNTFTITVPTPLLHDSTLGATFDGGLTKIGTGTLQLTGANTYTGPTTVRGGLLLVSAGSTGISTPSGLPDINFQLAPGASDTAAMSVTGGTVSADRVIVAGDTNNATGGSASLSLSSGTINASLWFSVGSMGNGTFTMASGTLNQNTAGGTQMEVAVFGNATGLATLGSNARINLQNNANLVLGAVNNTGTGTVNQNGGSLTFYADAGVTPGGTGSLILGGGSSTGTYTYNLNGGTLTVPAIQKTASGATGIFNFNGGALRPTASNAAFLQGLSAANVGALGAVVDTNSAAITIAQPLVHDPSLGIAADGGLTKVGAGTLVLAGAATYTGPTTVSAGVLMLNPAQATTPSLNLQASSQARFTGSKGALAATVSISGTTNAWTAQLDLGANALLVPTTPANKTSSIVTLANLIASGSAGTWSGNGITSSSVALNYNGSNSHNATLALVNNADLGAASFDGKPVDASTIIVTPALLGDVNLDGNVDLGDYDKWYKNVGTGTAYSYAAGDINMDGNIDLGDYDLWYKHVGASMNLLVPDMLVQAAVTGTASAVPEPGTLGLALPAAIPLLLRRRRTSVPPLGLGDLVARIADPFARALNALAGTRIGEDASCGCKRRQALLNRLVPDVRRIFRNAVA